MAHLPLAAVVFAAVPLALPALAQDSSSPAYEQRGDAWYRLEQGQAYRVYDGEVTVKFAAPVADLASFRAALGEGAAAFDGLSTARANRLGFHDLTLPAGSDPLDVVARLRATGLVEFAQEVTIGNYTGGVPNDPLFGNLWHLQNTGQTGGTAGADIRAVDGWLLEDGDPSITIAVVDSGTEWTHPDLAGAMWSNLGEVPNNGQDDDGNGFVDDMVGWNFQLDTNDPSSGFFHGTAVASVVGAVGNNGAGVVGVAGGGVDGAGCRVMALQIGEFGPISSLLDDAILYAMDNGASVITLSIGIGTDAAVAAAIDEAYDNGGLFINCSAGNGGGITYPATLPKVFAVGGTNHNDAYSGFSTGSLMDAAAPSSDIFMCSLGGSYTTSSGTSFGSPMVAALAGLILSRAPNTTNAQIADLIRDNADDVAAPGFDNQTGNGRINVAATLAAADVSIALFGAGTLTAIGTVPLISTGGESAVVGNSDFRFDLDDVRSGSIAVLALGLGSTPTSIPFAGGTFYVDLSQPKIFVAVAADGAGHGEFPLPIPGDPTLEGAHMTAQWVVQDPVAEFALSAALVATVGN